MRKLTDGVSLNQVDNLTNHPQSQFDSNTSGLQTRERIQEQFRTHPQPWFQWAYDLLTLSPGERILDLGAGLGSLWLSNWDRLPDGVSLCLTDRSLAMASKAFGRFSKILPVQILRSSAIFCADAQAVPLAAGQFDVVLGFGLLDIAPSRKAVLAEIHRQKKAGGRVFLSTGGRSHLQQIEEFVRPFLPQADFGGNNERFGLENGVQLLAPWFSYIRLNRYHDVLVFTRTDPIMQYILSESHARLGLGVDARTELISSLQQRLDKDGKISVDVEKGIFEAR